LEERAEQEKKKKLKKPAQEVRPNWSKQENSLRAFFDTHNGLEKNKVKIVDENKPHVIDLLDPLTIRCQG
jgi:hypothetical protein